MWCSVRGFSVVFDEPFAVGVNESIKTLAEGNGEGITINPSVCGKNFIIQSSSSVVKKKNFKTRRGPKYYEQREPSVLYQLLQALNLQVLNKTYPCGEEQRNTPAFINFYYQEHEEIIECLQSVLIASVLYIQIPPQSRIMSKEFFIQVLEFAEDVLHCSNVVNAFSANRSDSLTLCRMFNFLGFEMLPTCDVRHPASNEVEQLSKQHEELVLWNYEV